MSTLTDEDLTALLDGLGASYDVPPHGPDEVLAALAGAPAPVPLVRRRWLQLSTAAAVAVLAVVGMAVLAGSGGSGTSETAGSATTSNAEPFARRLDAQSGAVAGSGAAAAPDKAALPAPPVAGATGSTAQAPTGAVGAPPADGADSRVVKTGTIALVVDNGQVSNVIGAVQHAAKAHGGYIASSSSNEYGDTPSGEVTIRVPVANFEDLVAAVRGLDAEVRTATTSGKDVTAQYADIEAQLRTLRATRDRFLVILGQTKTISEILTVQQRVDNVSGQIDQLEGSRKLLASQSDLSTLTVSVSEKDDPVVRVAAHRGGFSQALHDAKDGFVTGVESIVRHSGRALLWLICLTGLALLGRAGWKVARRRLV